MQPSPVYKWPLQTFFCNSRMRYLLFSSFVPLIQRNVFKKTISAKKIEAKVNTFERRANWIDIFPHCSTYKTVQSKVLFLLNSTNYLTLHSDHFSNKNDKIQLWSYASICQKLSLDNLFYCLFSFDVRHLGQISVQVREIVYN